MHPPFSKQDPEHGKQKIAIPGYDQLSDVAMKCMHSKDRQSDPAHLTLADALLGGSHCATVDGVFEGPGIPALRIGILISGDENGCFALCIGGTAESANPTQGFSCAWTGDGTREGVINGYREKVLSRLNTPFMQSALDPEKRVFHAGTALLASTAAMIEAQLRSLNGGDPNTKFPE